MGQLQRLGVVFLLYTQDWDDRFPQAVFRRPEDQTWAPSLLVPSPADGIAQAPWNTPERRAAASMIWRNSTTFDAPYPSTTLLGAPEYAVSGDFYNGTPNSTNPTMNGLLHCFSFSAMENPYLVPMVWPGASRTNLKGRVLSNPALSCQSGPICLFNPTGPPSAVPTGGFDGVAFSLDFPVWIFGQTAPIIRADSSVALIPIGLKTQPDMHMWPIVNIDPWATVDSNGKGMSMWYCGAGHTVATPSSPIAGQGAYPCFFRPDRTE